MTFENIVGKGENKESPFPVMALFLTNFSIWATVDLSSENGKEFTYGLLKVRRILTDRIDKTRELYPFRNRLPVLDLCRPQKLLYPPMARLVSIRYIEYFHWKSDSQI